MLFDHYNITIKLSTKYNDINYALVLHLKVTYFIIYSLTIPFYNIQIVVAFVATIAFAQEEVESGPSPADEEVESGPSADADADAQGESVGVRKLRLRRPRPKIIGIENEDGIAQGNPVPLRAGKLVISILEFPLQIIKNVTSFSPIQL